MEIIFKMVRYNITQMFKKIIFKIIIIWMWHIGWTIILIFYYAKLKKNIYSTF